MNPNPLQSKLLAAARSHPPSDQVPYAFEKRILARLAHQPVMDEWAIWAQALWRAAAPCVAIALVLGVWTMLSPHRAAANDDLSQDFAHTLLAGVDQSEDLW